MPDDHWLFTTEGKVYLLEEYERQGRSVHEISEERFTYPMLVFRALKSHGIPRRSKGEAQKVALQNGRATHPTKGKKKPPPSQAPESQTILSSKGMDMSIRAYVMRGLEKRQIDAYEDVEIDNDFIELLVPMRRVAVLFKDHSDTKLKLALKNGLMVILVTADDELDRRERKYVLKYVLKVVNDAQFHFPALNERVLKIHMRSGIDPRTKKT